MYLMPRFDKSPSGLKISDFEDKSLLIVDDDDPFRDRLSRALEKKGFQPKGAKSVEIARQLIKTFSPKFAVVDLRLEGGNGLDIVKEIKNLKKDSKKIQNGFFPKFKFHFLIFPKFQKKFGPKEFESSEESSKNSLEKAHHIILNFLCNFF